MRRSDLGCISEPNHGGVDDDTSVSLGEDLELAFRHLDIPKPGSGDDAVHTAKYLGEYKRDACFLRLDADVRMKSPVEEKQRGKR